MSVPILVEKSSLKQEAENIAKELDILAILKKHGEARIVGSVELDLIVKLDLDIHVLLKKKLDLETNLFKISKTLLDNDVISEIRISDYREKDSFKIGVDRFSGPSGDWSIDIWLTKSEEFAGFNKIEEIRNRITPKLKSLILEIKEYYHNKGLLRNGLSNVIYDAVLFEQILTIGDFESYLADIGFFESTINQF